MMAPAAAAAPAPPPPPPGQPGDPGEPHICFKKWERGDTQGAIEEARKLADGGRFAKVVLDLLSHQEFGVNFASDMIQGDVTQVDVVLHDCIKAGRFKEAKRFLRTVAEARGGMVSKTFVKKNLRTESRACAKLFDVLLIYDERLETEEDEDEDVESEQEPLMVGVRDARAGARSSALRDSITSSRCIGWDEHVAKYNKKKVAFMSTLPRTCQGTWAGGPDHPRTLLPYKITHQCWWEQCFGGTCSGEASAAMCIVDNICHISVVRELTQSPNSDVWTTQLAAAVINNMWGRVYNYHLGDVCARFFIIAILSYLAVQLRYNGKAPPLVVTVLWCAVVKEALGEACQFSYIMRAELNEIEESQIHQKKCKGDSKRSLLSLKKLDTARKLQAVADGLANYFSLATVIDLLQIVMKIICCIMLPFYDGSAEHRAIVGAMCAGQWIQCLYLLRGFRAFGMRLMPILMAVKSSFVFLIVVGFSFLAATHFYYIAGTEEFYSSLLPILRLGLVADFEMDEFSGGYDSEQSAPASAANATAPARMRRLETQDMYIIMQTLFWVTMVAINVVLMQLLIGILGSSFEEYQSKALEMLLRERADLIQTYHSSILVKFTRIICGAKFEEENQEQEPGDHAFLWVAMRKGDDEGNAAPESAPACGNNCSKTLLEMKQAMEDLHHHVQHLCHHSEGHDDPCTSEMQELHTKKSTALAKRLTEKRRKTLHNKAQMARERTKSRAASSISGRVSRTWSEAPGAPPDRRGELVRLLFNELVRPRENARGLVLSRQMYSLAQLCGYPQSEQAFVEGEYQALCTRYSADPCKGVDLFQLAAMIDDQDGNLFCETWDLESVLLEVLLERQRAGCGGH